jgi:hypothetical protein
MVTHFESLRRRSGEINIPETKATITFSNRKWELHYDELGAIELPTEFGRALAAASKLKSGYLNYLQRKKIPRNPQIEVSPKRTFHARNYFKLDCHSFVARCLGFKLPLKYISRIGLGYTAHKDFFDPALHKKQTTKELKDALLKAEEPIQVLQIRDKRGQLTHSCLTLRIKDEILVVEAPGYANIGIEPIEQRFALWQNDTGDSTEYGDYFQFGPYSEVVQRRDLSDYFSKYHSTM